MQNAIKFSEENTNIRPEDGFAYTLPISMMLEENNETIEQIRRKIRILKKEESIPTIVQPYFHEKNSSKQEKAYQTVSMLTLIEDIPLEKGETPEQALVRKFKNQFKDKYIFVGESGTMIHDSFVSPVTKKIIP